MALRLVSNKPVRLELDGGDWLDVRSDISKKQFNALLRSLPEDFAETQSISPGESDAFASAIFEAFIIDWSLVDESGKKVPATLDNYLELTRESATAVDTAIMTHFNRQTPDEATVTKSEDASGE